MRQIACVSVAMALLTALLDGCGGGSGVAQRHTSSVHPLRQTCPPRIRLRISSTRRIGAGVAALAATRDVVWAADSETGVVVRLGPGGLRTSVALGGTPIGLSLGAGKLWVAERDANRVVALDSNSLARRARVGISLPVAVVAGPLGIWALSLDAASVYQLDPRRATVTRRVDAPVSDPIAMVEAGRELWVLGAGEQGLAPVSPSLGRIVRAGLNRRGQALSGLSAAGATVWLAETAARSLLRVDTRSVSGTRFPAPPGMRPVATASGPCGLWVGGSRGGLALIDPDTGAPRGALLRVGRSVASLGASGSGVWVSDPVDGALVRVDIAAAG